MTLDDFRKSTRGEPPSGLPAPLLALWHDARGEWDAAHETAQREPTAEGAWVHAYLHRREGDPTNAAYWYRQAGRPVAAGTAEEEWEQIARGLLEHGEA